MFPAALYARVQFCLRKSHAGPRVQQAPGLPCALYFEGGQTKMQTSGAMRRENAKVCLSSIVGWVERSETHRSRRLALMDIASLHPSYGTA